MKTAKMHGFLNYCMKMLLFRPSAKNNSDCCSRWTRSVCHFLITFNRYTYEFILDDLLAGVSPQLKDLVAVDLKKRLAMDRPTERLTGESANLAEGEHDSDVPGYDAILSKLHNPFEILDLFEKC